MFGSKLRFDVAERALWTGAQGALGVLITDLADVSMWWAAPIALVLASAKSWVAGRFGALGTGSTLPKALDPATPPRTVGPGPATGYPEDPLTP
ncbi:hypothetical protein [Streptomyces alboflavus]|uniref:hypothetical protein n=1 Tax=Streptomyces alboflavus TaxID=67267 RepID=UPI000F658756|nr:hypothetical protein [Streptomyces alboflavus]